MLPFRLFFKVTLELQGKHQSLDLHLALLILVPRGGANDTFPPLPEGSPCSALKPREVKIQGSERVVAERAESRASGQKLGLPGVADAVKQ